MMTSFLSPVVFSLLIFVVSAEEYFYVINPDSLNYCGHEKHRATKCGGHLASITSIEENNMVNQLILDTFNRPRRVWIGGDQAEEYRSDDRNNQEADPSAGWSWSDDLAGNWNDHVCTNGNSGGAVSCWKPNQPDNQINSNKGQHNMIRHEDGRWTDENGCAGISPKLPGVYMLPVDYEDTAKYPLCNDNRKRELANKKSPIFYRGPPRTSDGGAEGDPHFKTWAGEHYDFHGLCDLVLLENHSFQDDLGMDIHIRTKKMREWSYISNAVIRIGEDTLEVMGNKDGRSRYWVNGLEGDEIKVEKALFTSGLAGYPVAFQRINENQQEFRIDLGDEERVIIKTWNDLVRVEVLGANEENFGSSRGLMGKFPSGERLDRNGTAEMKDVNAFGQEWQVQVFEPKLFHNLEGAQSPNLCEAPTSVEMRRRLGESFIAQDQAELVCSHVNKMERRELCIFDVMATNNLDLARAY